MKNLAVNRTGLYELNEKVKQQQVLIKRTTLQTFDGPNLEKIRDTKREAKDNPKYTKDPNNACSL